MGRPRIFTVHRLGRLTAVRRVDGQAWRPNWLFGCSCGREVVLTPNQVRHRSRRSCGECLDSIGDRFESSLEFELNSGCWMWAGHITSDGYGRTVHQGEVWSTHRFAFNFYKRRLAEGEWVLHLCDTKLCCNPAHLFAGDHLANIADMVAKGRQQKGRKHWNAKITPQQVEMIRSDPRTGAAIAKILNLSKAQISRIRTGKRWRQP